MIVRPRGAASDWNPALYIKFVAERTRAARDLLASARTRRRRARFVRQDIAASSPGRWKRRRACRALTCAAAAQYVSATFYDRAS
jgi:trans-aconitate methyltransferase